MTLSGQSSILRQHKSQESWLHVPIASLPGTRSFPKMLYPGGREAGYILSLFEEDASRDCLLT